MCIRYKNPRWLEINTDILNATLHTVVELWWYEIPQRFVFFSLEHHCVSNLPRFPCAAVGSFIPPFTTDAGRSVLGCRHYCKVCDYETTKPSNLIRHIRVHTGKWPFQCHLCPRGYSEKTHLKDHLHTHTGERPYKCHLCPQSFSQKRVLNDHLCTHTGEQRYKCHLCLQSFRNQMTLKNHLSSHTGELPYQCPSCFKRFKFQSNLRRHMGQHKRQ